MAYLHCHNCDWQQDDFWTETYPLAHDNFSLFKFLQKCLLQDETEAVDGTIWNSQTYVARQLRKLADKIEQMEIKTEKDWKIVKDTWRCPLCKSEDWDID